MTSHAPAASNTAPPSRSPAVRAAVRTARPGGRRAAARVLVALGWLVLLAACESATGDPSAPSEGNWLGDRLYFRFQDGAISDVRPLGLSCTGEQDGLPCTAQYTGLVADTLPVVDGAFAGTLGELTLEGRFTAPDAAQGTILYQPADGCCSTTVAWTATWRAPQYADAGGPGADVAGGGPGPGPDAGELPGDLTPAQAEAIRITNEWRDRTGAPPLRSAAAIHRAAQAHADYYVANCDRVRAENLSPHAESPDHPGFTGASFIDRLQAQGWSGRGGWEIMAFRDDPARAIADWLDTLYHREPLIHPNAVEAGYGGAGGSGPGCESARVDVMDFGRGTPTATDYDGSPVRFPPDGATDVSPSWHGLESPQPPLPPGESYPSGPIVTLTFPEGGGALTVTAHRLEGPDGEAVPHVLRTPAEDPYLVSSLALYAHDPLAPGATYEVTFEGSRGNAPFREVWRFTTGP